jgi:hypothetical protein
LHALAKVLCYLKGTTSYGIHYTRYPRVLEGYSDSNWISDADETNAMSSYLFTLGVMVLFSTIFASYHLNKVNNRSRTHIIRHNHC